MITPQPQLVRRIKRVIFNIAHSCALSNQNPKFFRFFFGSRRRTTGRPIQLHMPLLRRTPAFYQTDIIYNTPVFALCQAESCENAEKCRKNLRAADILFPSALHIPSTSTLLPARHLPPPCPYVQNRLAPVMCASSPASLYRGRMRTSARIRGIMYCDHSVGGISRPLR